MSGTTPYQALPYPTGTDAPSGHTQMQSLATAIDGKLVMAFSSASARSTAITSPVEGMLCWLNDVDRYEFYDGSAWRVLPPAAAICQAVQTSAQGIANTGDVTVTLDADTYDPLGWHSTISNTSRITPTISGWYLTCGKASFSNTSGGGLRLCYVRKNGTTAVDGSGAENTSDASVPYLLPGMPALVNMNGSTDYLELVVQQSSTTNPLNTIVTTHQRPTLWVALFRAA